MRDDTTLVLVLFALGCGGLSRRTIEESDGAGAQAGGNGVSYSTTFDAVEAPLSEQGAWHHEGKWWTSVSSGAGNAFGTQPLAGRSDANGIDDSYAYLAGFPPDQSAEAVIHLGVVDPQCTHEVELLLRWTDSATTARGYECSLAYDGSYAEIIRWNGPHGDYEFLALGSVPGGVADGDTFSASVVGDRITLSVNGVERTSVTDSVITTGNPGIGFWRGLSGCGTFGDFAFTSFKAWSIDG